MKRIRKNEMVKYRKKIADIVSTLTTMTETEAESYLEGYDLILAQHCYHRVFGHYMNTIDTHVTKHDGLWLNA